MLPRTERPSSVKVPVLSNAKVVTRPARFTLGGEIQKILALRSRDIAKTVPQVMAAGKAGGTVIVIRSNDLSIRVAASLPYLSMIGTVARKPRIANTAMMATNFIPSS